MRLQMACLLCLVAAIAPANAGADEALEASVDQLRHAIGAWDVTTEFLDADGKITRTVDGTYRFWWVVEDRVVSGESDLPAMGGKTALLFYVDESDREIEMVSVNRSGRLWVMNGPLGSETRYTEPFETTEGDTGRLRFTRYNVSANRFESRMEMTTDGGETWVPGNHQVFVRNQAASEIPSGS